jgi:hypothetical protein
MRVANTARVARAPSTLRPGQMPMMWSSADALSGQPAPVPRANLAEALSETRYTPGLVSGTATPHRTLPVAASPTDPSSRATEEGTAKA